MRTANQPFGVSIDGIFFLPMLEYLDLAADLIANTEAGLMFPFYPVHVRKGVK